MPTFEFIDSVHANIAGANRLDALLETTLAGANTIGLAHVAIAQHAHASSGLMQPDIINNYPQAWRDLFLRREYALSGPVLAACQRRGGAVRWLDLEEIIPLTREQREYLEEARNLGLASGCTIASHLPHMPTISVHFVVLNNGPLDRRTFMMAQLIGIAAAQQARTLWLTKLPRLSAETGERLSPRQIECIKLVARGKTSWEIATVLGISDQTVSEYLTDARRRLSVANRAQLVLKALKQGYFNLDEVVD